MILRYPGGKSRGPLYKEIMKRVVSHTCEGFCEPFFGGGGVTIGLLKQGLISRLSIAEKDDSLRDLWYQIIINPKQLIRSIQRFEPSVDTFVRRKKLILNGKGSGFDALVVNRLAHGGRGVKAGPQGGFKQNGKYKIGCRWNPDKLVSDIRVLCDLFCNVDVFLRNDYHIEGDYYYYVDPPYWSVGDQLYLHNFTTADHIELKNFLNGKNFLLSYNNHEAVRDLYNEYNMEVWTTSGNGGKKKDSELLIWS